MLAVYAFIKSSWVALFEKESGRYRDESCTISGLNFRTQSLVCGKGKISKSSRRRRRPVETAGRPEQGGHGSPGVTDPLAATLVLRERSWGSLSEIGPRSPLRGSLICSNVGSGARRAAVLVVHVDHNRPGPAAGRSSTSVFYFTSR